MGDSAGPGGSIRLWTTILEAPEEKEGVDKAQKANFSHFTLFSWLDLSKNCKESVLARALDLVDAY